MAEVSLETLVSEDSAMEPIAALDSPLEDSSEKLDREGDAASDSSPTSVVDTMSAPKLPSLEIPPEKATRKKAEPPTEDLLSQAFDFQLCCDPCCLDLSPPAKNKVRAKKRTENVATPDKVEVNYDGSISTIFTMTAEGWLTGITSLADHSEAEKKRKRTERSFSFSSSSRSSRSSRSSKKSVDSQKESSPPIDKSVGSKMSGSQSASETSVKSSRSIKETDATTKPTSPPPEKKTLIRALLPFGSKSSSSRSLEQDTSRSNKTKTMSPPRKNSVAARLSRKSTPTSSVKRDATPSMPKKTGKEESATKETTSADSNKATSVLPRENSVEAKPKPTEASLSRDSLVKKIAKKPKKESSTKKGVSLLSRKDSDEKKTSRRQSSAKKANRKQPKVESKKEKKGPKVAKKEPAVAKKEPAVASVEEIASETNEQEATRQPTATSTTNKDTSVSPQKDFEAPEATKQLEVISVKHSLPEEITNEAVPAKEPVLVRKINESKASVSPKNAEPTVSTKPVLASTQENVEPKRASESGEAATSSSGKCVVDLVEIEPEPSLVEIEPEPSSPAWKANNEETSEEASMKKQVNRATPMRKVRQNDKNPFFGQKRSPPPTCLWTKHGENGSFDSDSVEYLCEGEKTVDYKDSSVHVIQLQRVEWI